MVSTGTAFSVRLLLSSVAETRDVAARLADVLEVGDLLLMTGGIGSGKTTFVQALAEALGVRERVTSPSFVLQAVYESGRISLSHVDLYRLDNDIEIEGVGFEEYLDTSVTAVEWAERYTQFRPPYLILQFAFGPREGDRVLNIVPQGADWFERLKAAFSGVET